MKKIFSLILVSVYMLFVAAPLVTIAVPTNVSAGPACEARFLGIPPWYRGLTDDGCVPKVPDTSDDNAIGNFIWKIVLNGIEMALVITAYIAIFFIIYGGFQFMTGGSNPSQVEKARKTILNAVIGLVIAMGAISIVNFIFSLFGAQAGNENGIIEMTGEELLRNGLNLTYFIGGVIAVIVIVISGINYVISSGDAAKITKAKNMLTYSIVGLIIVVTAFAITNFVIGRFS